MSSRITIDILQVLINQQSIWEPVCDIRVTKDRKVVLELDVPDLDIKSLSVNIINGERVEIVGERKRNTSEECVYMVAERVFGKFRKIIDLPFLSSKVEEMYYVDGVLKIVLQGV